MKLIERNVRGAPASSIIQLETYTTDDHLIVAKSESNKWMVGRVLEATPLIGGGTDFALTLNSAIRGAPDNSVIQVSQLCTVDLDAPDRYARGKSMGNRAAAELVERHRRVLQGACQIGWRDDEPPLNVRSTLISLALPVPDVGVKTLTEVAARQIDFHQNVRRSSFADARVLSAAELVAVYRQFVDVFNRRQHVALDELVELRFQVFGPDQEFDFGDRHVGRLAEDIYFAGVGVKSFPTRPIHGLMNVATGGVFKDGIAAEGGGARILTPYIATTTIRVANQSEQAERVERAISSRKAKRAPFRLGSEDPAEKLNDLQIIKKQCAAGEDKFVFVSTNVFAFGRTPVQARASAGNVAGIFVKLGFDAREIKNNLGPRFAQALPLNFSPKIAAGLSNEALMSSSACNALLPMFGDFRGNVPRSAERSGMSLVTRRGQLLSVDIWQDQLPHGLVVAQSGAGKTVALEFMVANQLSEGARVVAVDDGCALKKFCHALGGTFIEFGGVHGYKPSLNPYSGLQSDEEFDAQEEVISALVLLMAYDDEPAEPGARIAASESVRAAWAAKQDQADLTTVVDALITIARSAADLKADTEVTRAATNMVPRLKAFLESPSRGAYFRGECSLNVESMLTVFEMGGLGESHLKKCVSFFVTNMVMSRLKFFRGRKLLLIDEAKETIKNPSAADVVGAIYRKGRKDQVAIWVVMQSMLELAELPVGKVIIGHSYWKWILYQEASELEQLFSSKLLGRFNDDPYYRNLVKSVRSVKGSYSEIMVQSPDWYEVGRLFLDRFTTTLLDSEGPSRERIFQLMSDGVDVVDAVERVLGNNSRQRRRWIDEFVSELRDTQGLTPEEVVAEVREALE